MTLWKQRLLARYQAPADGEGGDLPGGNEPTDNTPEPSAIKAAADAIGENAPDPEPQPGASDEPQPPKKLTELLDSLTEGAEAKKPEEKPAEPAAAKPGEKPAEPKADDKPEADKEESELLEGVNSPRGKERVRQVFQENKTLKGEIDGFKQMVQSTGMSAEQFAQTLEFGRLVSSGTPENLQLAVELIEQQRTQLYAALGKEAPGVDLLTEFPDLKEAVDNMEVTRERAVELAKHRRVENQQKATRQQQQQQEKFQTELKQTVEAASGQMATYLQTRANEVDHPARMAALGEKFKDPAFMQDFVSTYKPEQWVGAIKMLYDTIALAPKPAPRVNDPQPMRSRVRTQGNPVPAGAAPIDRLAGHLENMGL